MGELIELEIVELLLQKKHFYGHLLQQFRRHAVTGKDIPTLGVQITDDLQPHLYINTNFYNSGDYNSKNPQAQSWGMTQEEKIAVLEHEILHILNKHPIRLEGRNHYVWNLANDVAINQYIKGLPYGLVCPDCNILVRKLSSGGNRKKCPKCGKELDPNQNKWEPLDVDNFNIGANKIKLDHEKASEVYYDTLWEAIPKVTITVGSSLTSKQESDARQNHGGSNNGSGEKGNNQTQPQNQGSGDAQLNGCGCNVSVNSTELPLPMDNHSLWDSGSGNREMAHEKIKEMVRKALENAGDKSQGYMPAWLQGLVKNCLEHKTVTWKSELRRFYGFREFSKFVSTRKRLNRRFPITFPGYKVTRKARFVVATDSSGSIGDKEFAQFWAEMIGASKAGVSLTHVECDADITHVREFKKTPPKGGNKRYGYGGTDFRPVFEFVKHKTYKNGQGETFQLKGKIDGIIYCTDGYGTYPTSVPCPTIWVMTPNHSVSNWNPKLGKVIVMAND